MLKYSIAFLTVFVASISFAQAQVIYDGVNCNATPSAHGTSDEWGTAMATDIDGINPGSSDIEEFWAKTEGRYLYFAFSRRSGGNAGFTFYANTDCDLNTGDQSYGGADFALHFTIQTGVVQDDTIYQWDPNTGVNGDFIATKFNFNAIIGGSSCADSSDDKFFELRFPITEFFDPCQSACDSFTIEIGTTNAGGSFRSAIKDGFTVNIPVYVNELPVSIASYDEDICYGSTVTLDASSSKFNIVNNSSSVDDSISVYSWDFDNDGVYDATGKTVSTNAFAAVGTHQFKLRVEDSYGCLDSVTSNVITTHDLPTINMSVLIDNSPTLCRDFIYYFDGSSSIDEQGNLIYSTGTFDWTLDADGSTFTDSAFSHTFGFCLWDPSTGDLVYDDDVHLTITDQWGCVNSNVSDIAVPVELVSFTGEVVGEGALLRWQTASEINSDYFVIERSSDGINFEQIGTVAAAGNSMEIVDYQFLDPQMGPGDNYYRLVQYDFDGSSEIFNPIVLRKDQGSRDIGISPNPGRDVVNVELPESRNGGELQVLDMTGRVVLNKTINSSRGVSSISLDVSTLPEGLYYVRFGNAEQGADRKSVV